MWRRFLMLSAGIACTGLSCAQLKKQFSVEENNQVEKVNFNFKVNSGDCFVKPGESLDLLNVYGNQDYNKYSHTFNKQIENGACTVDLTLEQDKFNGLGQSISYRMFGSSEEDSNSLWKVFLSEQKTYNLDLNYGVGSANVDLSGLSIEKLKIRTGSADVNIGYFSGLDNKVRMDTFYVQVDLGSVTVKKLNLSKSKQVIADIGFGNLMLDFSDKPEESSNITGSVGAGNLWIVLPDDNETPIKVKINDSWLCRVKLTDSFHKISPNTFVNKSYTEDAPNLLSFNLDVSMGNIVFKESDSKSVK